MGSDEPAYPKIVGPKTIQAKAKNQTKIVYNQKKPKINLFENKKKVQKTVKNPKKTKNNKKHKVTVYMLFPDEM